MTMNVHWYRVHFVGLNFEVLLRKNVIPEIGLRRDLVREPHDLYWISVSNCRLLIQPLWNFD